MRNIVSFFSFLAIVVLMTSCNEDPEYFELRQFSDDMKLNVSVSEITFSEDKLNETAVTFTWNAVSSPISSSDTVTYDIRFYDATQKEDHMSKTIELGAGVTEKSFTHRELNNIVSRWVVPGEPVEVTAQLLATVHNKDKYVKPMVSLVTFNAICFERFPTNLYLKITDDGTGVTTTQRLEQLELGSGVFCYSGDMTPCSFVIGTKEDEEFPVYAQKSEEQMTLVTEGTYVPFKLDNSVLDAAGKPGYRTIVIDLNDEYLDCRVVEMVKVPDPNHMWIVGDGCSVGWNPNHKSGLFKVVEGCREPWMYYWTGTFCKKTDSTEGMFKIGLENDYDGLFFFAPQSGADPTTEHALVLRKGGADDKWLVPDEADGVHTLKICLLAKDLHMEFE